MTTSYAKLKNKSLKDGAVKKEYDALAPEYELVTTIIAYRLKRGWSQQRLAEEMGTRQPVISRLERGEGNPSLHFLQRIAEALGAELRVTLG